MAAVAPATPADIPRIVDMIEHLQRTVRGAVTVDRAWTSATVGRLIACPQGGVWVSRGGFIAGSILPTIINPVPVAMEHGWWATDNSGIRLLRVFEAWARDRGATLIQMSTGPDGTDLSRLGYRMVERAWVKEWQCSVPLRPERSGRG